MAKSEKIMVLWILIVVVGLLGFAIVQMPSLDDEESEGEQRAAADGSQVGEARSEDVGDRFYDIFRGEAFAGGPEEVDTSTEPPLGKGEIGTSVPVTRTEPPIETAPPVETQPTPPVEKRRLTEPSRDGSYDYYTIQPGDSYSKIAQKLYGSAKHWPELKKANEDVPVDGLQVGRRILVPKKHLLSSGAIAQANPDGQGPLSRRIADPAPTSGGTYTVRRGDTFYSLAKRFGVSVDQLFEMNRRVLRDPADLRTGLTLRVP